MCLLKAELIQSHTDRWKPHDQCFFHISSLALYKHAAPLNQTSEINPSLNRDHIRMWSNYSAGPCQPVLVYLNKSSLCVSVCDISLPIWDPFKLKCVISASQVAANETAKIKTQNCLHHHPLPLVIQTDRPAPKLTLLVEPEV